MSAPQAEGLGFESRIPHHFQIATLDILFFDSTVGGEAVEIKIIFETET